MEYDKAFQVLRERGASRNKIVQEDLNLVIAVDSLVQGGIIVGQKTLEEDVICYLNPERNNTPVEINSAWRVPQYATPEERLKRPVELKNGTTRTYEQTRILELRAELDSLTLEASRLDAYKRL